MPIIEIFKTPQPKREMRAFMPRGGRRPTHLENLVNLVQLDSQGLLDSRAPLESENSHFQVTFQVTLRENGLLCGWWVRIWTGAGSQPAHADECLDLFQNINLIGRQQPPSSDSLIWWKSRKVQLDMLFYRTTFLLCLDETRPTCCRYFLFTME